MLPALTLRRARASPYKYARNQDPQIACAKCVAIFLAFVQTLRCAQAIHEKPRSTVAKARALQGGVMVSNLASARALLQADLEHARSVLNLWAHQVAELEKALQQIDAVSVSRDGLRAQYQAAKETGPMLGAPAAIGKPARRGRKPSQTASASAASKSGSVHAPAKRGRKAADAGGARTSGPAGKVKRTVAGNGTASPKYQDPKSGRTWTGRGRHPLWFKGDPNQYLIRANGEAANVATRPAASAANGRESAPAASA
jgi:DNA-binding protein H-NS